MVVSLVNIENYLLIIPSTLTRPGPQSKMAKKPERYTAESSPLPNKCPFEEMKNAYPKLIMTGSTVNLVNKPSVTKMEQKNSANTTNASVAVLPMPKRFTKESLLSSK